MEELIKAEKQLHSEFLNWYLRIYENDYSYWPKDEEIVNLFLKYKYEKK